MPDQRKHRGPHPQDPVRFAPDCVERLQSATRDLSWLLTRDYASTSALKLTGDRYSLDTRQRLAVARSACRDHQRELRQRRKIPAAELRNSVLWIDGYNVLTSIETALSGGVILMARDGCFRDMASMHGSFRKVDETVPAIQLLGELLAEWRVSHCRWLFDQPVSNSGRLKSLTEEIAADRGWNWSIQLVADPDKILVQVPDAIASADSHVLDFAHSWFNAARTAIEQRIPDAWLVDLSDQISEESACRKNH